MQDQNSKLLEDFLYMQEKFQDILKQLTFHAKESNCQHSVPELLDELELESDE